MKRMSKSSQWLRFHIGTVHKLCYARRGVASAGVSRVESGHLRTEPHPKRMMRQQLGFDAVVISVSAGGGVKNSHNLWIVQYTFETPFLGWD